MVIIKVKVVKNVHALDIAVKLTDVVKADRLVVNVFSMGVDIVAKLMVVISIDLQEENARNMGEAIVVKLTDVIRAVKLVGNVEVMGVIQML